MIWIPMVEHIVRLHSKVTARSGGSDGVRDFGLIESALMRAVAGFGDYDIYPTAVHKAAAVCCGLVGNHGFIDGNKRIGVAAMLLMLKKNGVVIQYTQQELIELGLDLAKGLVSVEECILWIEQHMKQQKGVV